MGENEVEEEVVALARLAAVRRASVSFSGFRKFVRLPTPHHTSGERRERGRGGGAATPGGRRRRAIATRMDAVLGRRLVVSFVVAFWLGALSSLLVGVGTGRANL